MMKFDDEEDSSRVFDFECCFDLFRITAVEKKEKIEKRRVISRTV